MSKEVFDIEAAKQAVQATETMDGLRLEGNNHKIGQLLSLRDHLINALALIESPPTTLDQIKADAVMLFANNNIGAYESGFIDQNYCTLSELYRSAQHHVKDNYNIDTPSMSDAWGEKLFQECLLDSTDIKKIKDAIRSTIAHIEDINALRPEDGGESLRLLEEIINQ